jgi:hypothetical protein
MARDGESPIASTVSDDTGGQRPHRLTRRPTHGGIETDSGRPRFSSDAIRSISSEFHKSADTAADRPVKSPQPAEIDTVASNRYLLQNAGRRFSLFSSLFVRTATCWRDMSVSRSATRTRRSLLGRAVPPPMNMDVGSGRRVVTGNPKFRPNIGDPRQPSWGDIFASNSRRSATSRDCAQRPDDRISRAKRCRSGLLGTNGSDGSGERDGDG